MIVAVMIPTSTTTIFSKCQGVDDIGFAHQLGLYWTIPLPLDIWQNAWTGQKLIG